MTVELAAARQCLDDERTHTQTRLVDQRAGYKTDSPNSVPLSMERSERVLDVYASKPLLWTRCLDRVRPVWPARPAGGLAVPSLCVLTGPVVADFYGAGSAPVGRSGCGCSGC
jgi:hypothetical protein